MTDFSVENEGMGGIRASDNTSIFGVKAGPVLRPRDCDRHHRLRFFLDLEPVERRRASALAEQLVMAHGLEDRAPVRTKSEWRPDSTIVPLYPTRMRSAWVMVCSL